MGDNEIKYVFLYNGSDWLLQIDSLDVLNSYMRMIWNIRREDLEWDLKNVKEGKPITSQIISTVKIIADMRHSDLWHEFTHLRDRQHREMSRLILSGKTLYVNTEGGYCTQIELVVMRHESEVLRWPVFSGNDTFIRKLPEGYAYIGPIKNNNVLK